MTVLDKNTTSDWVYTNLDHTLTQSVADELLKERELWGQHAASAFCGWIKYDHNEDIWVEEIWVRGACVAVKTDKSIQLLIEKTNDEYGSD